MSARIRKGLAVVTGAGSGLGRALSLELIARGVRVAGIGRRADALQQTAEKAGHRFTPVPLDVSDFDAVQEAFQHLRTEIGPITLLINNASVYPRRDFLDETPESFMRSVSINLGGVVTCTHAALQDMIAVGAGRIMSVSTFADLKPLPTASAYSVSKGAARIFTRALVADLADRFPNIVVNDWVPGALATEMGIPDGIDPAVAARWGATLALWEDPSLTGTVFDRDCEQLLPRTLKRRLVDKALLRSAPKPRRLDSTESSITRRSC